MEVERITPIFAAFEFESGDHSKKAFRRMRDNDGLRNVSVWTVATPDYSQFIMVILGEEQSFVDFAAEIAMESEGCLANYVLDELTMSGFMQRRYGLLARALENGETKVHQEQSYGAGAKMRHGRIIDNQDAPEVQ